MVSEVVESIRSQIVTLSKQGLSQYQIISRLKVCKGAVYGTLDLLKMDQLFSEHDQADYTDTEFAK